MEREPNVKGVAFRSVLRALEALRGPDAVEATLQHLPSELETGLRHGGMVAGGWYPISSYKALFRAITTATGEGRDLVRAIGAQCSEQDLKGVYRYLLRMLAPHTIYSVTPKIFGNYYDTGSVDVIESRKGFAHTHWKGCVGFDQNMWEEVLGSSARVLELAGASHVRIHVIRGGGAGHDELEARAFWT